MGRASTPLKRQAERFEMQLPIRYHLSDSDRWVDAKTINVSHRGVLARAAEDTIPSGPVDFEMALPPCGIVQLARVRCSGRFVRVAGAAAFALSIDRYRFMKPGESDPAGEGAQR